MRIAILGTRGIPNNHGGFEQFAEYLAPLLVNRGFDVTVYNSHNHPFQEQDWKGVHIVHCYDPEYRLGTAGQFVYDLNCIMDTRKRKFDIILQLGYTSSSIWGSLYPKAHSIVTTNMDGLEWKRSKYSKPVQKFLKLAERLAVKHSDYLISDSIGIQKYLKNKFDVNSDYIPYGADLFSKCEADVLKPYDVQPYRYNMMIARLEPENSLEVILDGVYNCSSMMPFLVVGRHRNKFGKYLKDKYRDNKRIQFIGGIYDINVLNNMRFHSNIYFHGHTVGGTNPSLLEAMASNALICAHDNVFNKSILLNNAYYFSTSGDVKELLDKADQRFKAKECNQNVLRNNTQEIIQKYSWNRIAEQYIHHFNCIKNFRSLGMNYDIAKVALTTTVYKRPSASTEL